jgi:hypothetical protein
VQIEGKSETDERPPLKLELRRLTVSSAASIVAVPVALRQSTRNPALPCNAYCVCSLVQNLAVTTSATWRHKQPFQLSKAGDQGCRSAVTADNRRTSEPLAALA